MSHLNVLIGIDRDGTLIQDDGNFPGSKWPNETFTLCPHVVEGLKRFRTINEFKSLGQNTLTIKTAMITNQSGPARGIVNAEHIPEVNNHINDMLRSFGVQLDAVYHCEHPPHQYAQDCIARGKKVDMRYVCDCPDWKPGTGMLQRAAQDLFDTKLDKVRVYVIGDRCTDLQTALNAKGTGIWLPSDVKDHNDRNEALALRTRYGIDKIMITNDFLDAAVRLTMDLVNHCCAKR